VATSSSVPTRSSSFRYLLLGLGLSFLFRLGYGLCSDIWFIDQQQVYLIGLKYFCTGDWPYFGADVGRHIQLPGALQGLVVGLPLRVFSIPESPYLFLNLLSFIGLVFFSWYCAKRLPQFPRWVIYTWLFTAPWTLNWSTNIDNDSYVLFASCLFFPAFLETVPELSLGILPASLANALMGFAFFWTVQFHMSFVLMAPFILTSLYCQTRHAMRALPRIVLFLFLGSLLSGVFLIPTFVQYGPVAGMGGSQNAVTFNAANILSFPVVLARYLSLASCEIPRFLGANTAGRLAFLNSNPWLWPVALITFLGGLAQALALLFLGFRNQNAQKDWTALRILALATFLLIYFSFIFAIKVPAAHTYYLALPVAMLYGFYAFSPFMTRRWFRILTVILLSCNILLHAGLAAEHFQSRSLYKNRELFVKAIQDKNYHLLGERRPETLY
jgi:hypothetical protein